jgi:hypothetical protein
LLEASVACYGVVAAAPALLCRGPTHKPEGKMSKVKKLVDAGLVDEQELTDEHKQTIENEITTEEIEILLQVGKKMKSHPKVGLKKVGCVL